MENERKKRKKKHEIKKIILRKNILKKLRKTKFS